MKVDMHTHTFYSDGLYSPNKLIDLAIKKNLSGISITDHDTVDSLDEAMRYSSTLSDFTLIPGIEFGCEFDNKEVHLLGYFIDYKDINLIEAIKRLKRSRVERGEKMVAKLASLGLDIKIEEVKKHARDDYIGRPHIARALIDKGYVKSIDEAFDKYLKNGASAYVKRYQLSIKESIELIENINGISVLAHPALIEDRNIIDYVISLGIKGLECYHSKHSPDETNELLRVANENNLIISGGSDFHGDVDILGNHYIDFNSNPRLKRRLYND